MKITISKSRNRIHVTAPCNVSNGVETHSTYICRHLSESGNTFYTFHGIYGQQRYDTLDDLISKNYVEMSTASRRKIVEIANTLDAKYWIYNRDHDARSLINKEAK